MGYRVTFSKRAEKEMRKLEKSTERLIISWIEKNLENCDNPRAIVGSRQLIGTENGWRYRIGNYRILAEILDDELIVNVVRTGHRQSVYSNLPEDL
jgi:mRNA interferase RelE/StbE